MSWGNYTQLLRVTAWRLFPGDINSKHFQPPMNTGRAASEVNYRQRRDETRYTEMVRYKGGCWQHLLLFQVSVSSLPHIHASTHLFGPLLQDRPSGTSHFSLPLLPLPVSPWLQRSRSTSTQKKLSTGHLWVPNQARWCSCSTNNHRTIITYLCVPVTQLCPNLWDPMDSSPLGSSVHGILQAKILEWVASSFSNHIPTGLITKVSMGIVSVLYLKVRTYQKWYKKSQILDKA